MELLVEIIIINNRAIVNVLCSGCFVFAVWANSFVNCYYLQWIFCLVEKVTTLLFHLIVCSAKSASKRIASE